MRGGSINLDKYVTMFSEEGKLLQVEYSFKAASNFSPTCIGIKGKDSVCGIIDSRSIEALNDQRNLLNFFNLNGDIGCLHSGFQGDILMHNKDISCEAYEYHNSSGINIPIEYLIKKLSDRKQLNTQYIYSRPLAIKSIIFGFDINSNPMLFKIDPSGYSASGIIYAIGEKEAEINNYIFKKSKFYSSHNFSYLETLTNGILLLHKILKCDIKATDLKIFVATSKRKKIKALDEVEIDRYLNFLDKV